MKSIKFFALSLLAIASSASAKINFSASIARGQTLYAGSKLTLELDQRELCYQDATAYIEAELIEEKAEEVTVQFTVATKNETGAFMVRGLPKLIIPINHEVTNSSLRCDGPTESFTLVINVEKVEEVVAAAQ